MSTSPSTCTQGPKKPSLMTHNDAWGQRWRFLAFMAVSRVLTTTLPSPSTATTTGEA